MKEYNCPDCKLDIYTCNGCPRVPLPTNTYEPYKITLEPTITYENYDPDDPCVHCLNNPKNGGSGICLCTIPYFSKGPKVY